MLSRPISRLSRIFGIHARPTSVGGGSSGTQEDELAERSGPAWLHTLDWLEQPPLRRQATAELNKGETRHALCRAVRFHRLGRLRDRTVELQQHRASELALVTAAIALRNTVCLGRAVDTLCRHGERVPTPLAEAA
jgi:TnpA family transposase